jgi:hypothetical protein
MTLACSAQDAKPPRPSPHDKASATVGKTNITMEYGRPFLKGRHVGGEVAPYGEVWRTGADEATTLVTNGDLTIGTLKVPKGSYTVFTLPTKDGWTLIVNRVESQWGAFEYKQDMDLGRTKMTVKTAKTPVEQFTITLTGGVLKMAWDTTEASVQIMGK